MRGTLLLDFCKRKAENIISKHVVEMIMLTEPEWRDGEDFTFQNSRGKLSFFGIVESDPAVHNFFQV